jgi:hypothetical protein
MTQPAAHGTRTSARRTRRMRTDRGAPPSPVCRCRDRTASSTKPVVAPPNSALERTSPAALGGYFA